ncbi:MAG: hypothetical protein FJ248_06255 [Nitrospira sp.]|nr:hypothetical protein [Nitrospira sp.]
MVIRILTIAVALTGALGMAPEFALAQSDSRLEMIPDGPLYFPDAIGSRWRYRGHIETLPLQQISERKTFVNISSVTGTQTINGVPVKVFHDTNPGNHGATNSYYRRDAVGIIYYGSSPGTPVERQVTPYQIVHFPIDVPSSFQQFERKGIDFDNDLDGDGSPEKADVEASVTVVGKESVTVPAGTYADALKLEARMSMRIHLSKTKRSVVSTDLLTAWFAKGIGLVKYTEHQEMPPAATDRGGITNITEELEGADIKTVESPVSQDGRIRAAAYAR